MSNLIDPLAGSAPAPAPSVKPAPAAAPAWHVISGVADPLHTAKKAALYGIAGFFGLLALACLVIIFVAWRGGDPTPPAPTPPADFIALGREYQADLAKVYAGAWDEGAHLLEAGQQPKAALSTVASSWDTGRTQLFEAKVSPVFAKIVPEGTKDVSAVDLARLAQAWHGFARGLRGSE